MQEKALAKMDNADVRETLFKTLQQTQFEGLKVLSKEGIRRGQKIPLCADPLSEEERAG